MDDTEGEMVIRDTTSTHDVASLIACFCLSQTCPDWFLCLPFTGKIEIVFLLRTVIYGLCDSGTAKRMITLFESADSAVPALDLVEKIINLQEDELNKAAATMTWRWSVDEDVCLLSSMLHEKMVFYRAATGRTTRAIRRRIQHWIDIARHLLSLDTCDIKVDESIKQLSDAISDVESVENEPEQVFEKDEDAMAWPGDSYPGVRMTALEWSNMTRGKRMATMARTGKSVQALKKQCVKLRMTACRAAKQYKRANRVVEGLEPDLRLREQAVGNMSDRDPRISLLQQFCDLAKTESAVSKRYPRDVKNFWMEVYSVSPSCFDHMSWLMNGPCRTTVKSWMRAKKEVIRNELLNLESITEIADRWSRKWGGKTGAFTLSYDACKLDEDLVINQNGQVSGVVASVTLDVAPVEYKLNPLLYQKIWEQQIINKNLITHAFVFMLNPVSNARGFPVHVVFSNSGSANEQVMHCIREIPKLLGDFGIHVEFEASDSDNKYRMAFTKQFRVMYQQFSKLYVPSYGGCELCLLDRVEVPSPRRCNDIPHILKRWRARLINNDHLFITPESERQGNVWINVNVIREINPSISNTAFRQGSMASMDDLYPRMIFNIQTLMSAWSQRRFDVVTFLLPAVCAEIVFRKEGISRQRRMEFAFLGWCTCIYYFSLLEDCAKCNTRFRYPVISRDLAVDLGNALFCQMRAMRVIEREYRTSKVSSVISEHFFARMRRSMGPDQSYDNFLRILLRTVVCDLKDSRQTETLSMSRRLFDSALCEHGVGCLSHEAVLETRDFLSALFRVNDVQFSANADHLATFATANDYTLDTSQIIRSFLELAQDVVHPSRFTIHAGQNRMRRIYGRSIISRFKTAAKQDSTAAITVEERLTTAEEDTSQIGLQLEFPSRHQVPVPDCSQV